MHQAESSSSLSCLWTGLSLLVALHPAFSTTQLPSARDRPVFPSDRDFHPTVGAYSQAHFSCPFGARDSPRTFLSLGPFRHVTDSSNAAGRYEINGRRKI